MKLKKIILTHTAIVATSIVISKMTKPRAGESKELHGIKFNIHRGPLDGFNMVAETTGVHFGEVSVYTDCLFDMLPKDMQEACLMHEAGHVLCKGGTPETTDDYQRYALQRQMYICPREEKVADKFSYEHCGKATLKLVATLGLLNPIEAVQRVVSLIVNH